MNTEIIDFTGGMHTVKAPHMIDKSECRAIVNVDIRQGSLMSMPLPKFLENAVDSHFTQFLGKLRYYGTYRYNAIMNNNLYWTDGVNNGKIMWDGRELPLGLPTPVAACSLTAIDTGSGVHKGDFKYTYTFYDTSTGAESAPAPLPPYLTVDKDNIRISGLEALPDVADRYRIYRIGGYLPRFTMVAELKNTDTPYDDKLDEAEIDGRLLRTMRAGEPLVGMSNFVELGGRLFGSIGTKVYFSAVGNPDAWYASDFIIMPDRIEALAKSPAGLLVMGKSYTYLLAGNQPSNFRLRVVSNVLGCISGKSVDYIGDKAIWLGATGIYTTDGYAIINLTGDKIKSVGELSPTSSVVLNDVYYLHYNPSLVPTEELFPTDELFPAASQGVNDLEEGIIYLDMKRGRGYSYGLLSFSKLAFLGSKDGRLHGTSETANRMYLNCDEPLGCADYLNCSRYDLNILGDRKHKQFATVAYVSPMFIDGSYATLKQYDKVRVNVLGNFNVAVIFSNGEVAIEQSILTKNNENIIDILRGDKVSFSRDNVTTIGIPNSNNLSYGISFVITGIGVIKSIQYSWKNRELD